MNQDFLDLLRAFTAAEVRFLLVGAYALGLHGKPRATGDLDVWVEHEPHPSVDENVRVNESGHGRTVPRASTLETAPAGDLKAPTAPPAAW